MINYVYPLYKDFKFLEMIDFIQNWTWRELNIGLEIELIDNVDVIEYSKSILQEGIQNFDLILDIAISDDVEDIKSKVQVLANLEKDEQIDVIMDKWRFAMLLQLYFKREQYTNVYEKIAEIGADFNHPKDMDGLIYYFPSTGISIEKSWINYIKEQCKRFGIHYLL